MNVLVAHELYRFFHTGDEEVRALRGVDFAVSAGEIVALMGPSGSGKSTLLMCLAGLDEPDGGHVEIEAERMTRRSEIEKTKLRSKYFGLMLQKENLFSHLTVLENMKLAQSLVSGFDREKATTILSRVGLAERLSGIPAQLSGGEKARASLAVAMSNNPPILLLDEPTGEVDEATEQKILDELDNHARQGGAIVIATHNYAVAGRATRIVKMKDGKIVK